jgi:hypothetical protein
MASLIRIPLVVAGGISYGTPSAWRRNEMHGEANMLESVEQAGWPVIE